MARQVVIVGGGEVGTHLGSLLLVAGHQVTVIEKQREDVLACSGRCPPP
jgi:2-polyprenyl-6-methoxyphenol hydroxylase-like FAD-dependent oxidoreductase